MLGFNDDFERICVEIQRLKAVPRTGWKRCGVQDIESVAAHSWGVSWMVVALCPENLDRQKCLEMAVIHDLAEVRVGDITPYDGITSEQKHVKEDEALHSMLGSCSSLQRMLDLYEEYRDARTEEAKFVHYCDKLDMAWQALCYMEANPCLDLREFLQSVQKFQRLESCRQSQKLPNKL